jgi:hypothetical protein
MDFRGEGMDFRGEGRTGADVFSRSRRRHLDDALTAAYIARRLCTLAHTHAHTHTVAEAVWLQVVSGNGIVSIYNWLCARARARAGAVVLAHNASKSALRRAPAADHRMTVLRRAGARHAVAECHRVL